MTTSSCSSDNDNNCVRSMTKTTDRAQRYCFTQGLAERRKGENFQKTVGLESTATKGKF